MKTPYSSHFFAEARRRSRRSAEAILPGVVDLLNPARVIDIGCGIGTWLGVLTERGIEVLGVDGDYVDRTMLEVPKGRFIPHDLREPLPPLGSFDLAISMETAEHLPPTRALGFIADLVRLAPVVLFSAAVPGQGGTHHINEQWPGYWADLFQQHGFTSIDCVRPQVWSAPDIDWWYAQNVFLAVHGDLIARNDPLRALAQKHGPPRALVHPGNYLEKYNLWMHARDVRNHSLADVLRALPSMMWNYLLRRRKRGPETG